MYEKERILACSGNNEWYTPIAFIEAAREVMGTIDLDPASCSIANETVQAEEYYDKDINGLTQTWYGNIWLNPPYDRKSILQFADKIVSERDNYKQLCALTNNATDTSWWQKIANISSACLFTRGRVKFYSPDGRIAKPIQGQTVLYIGDNTDRFIKYFSRFGWCARI